MVQEQLLQWTVELVLPTQGWQHPELKSVPRLQVERSYASRNEKPQIIVVGENSRRTCCGDGWGFVAVGVNFQRPSRHFRKSFRIRRECSPSEDWMTQGDFFCDNEEEKKQVKWEMHLPTNLTTAPNTG